MSDLVHVKGLDDATAAFRGLTPELRKSVLRPSSGVCAGILRDGVRSAAPIGPSGAGRHPGQLKRAIYMYFDGRRSNDVQVYYKVGIRKGKSAQKSRRDAYYASWVERGHRIVSRKGRATGNVPPHPFFIPAFNSRSGAAVSGFFAEFSRRCHSMKVFQP